MKIKHIELKPLTWIHPQLSLISRCALDIYMRGNNAVVIATDREDNHDVGMSITDGAQMIAAMIMHKYGFTPEALTWIERHIRQEQDANIFEESYNLVKFEFDGTGFQSLSRDRIDKKPVEAMIK